MKARLEREQSLTEVLYHYGLVDVREQGYGIRSIAFNLNVRIVALTRRLQRAGQTGASTALNRQHC